MTDAGMPRIREAAARLSAEPVSIHNAIRVEAAGADSARAVIDRIEPFHKGGAERGLINGGILQALLERAMRAAAAAAFEAGPTRLVSLDQRWLGPVLPRGVTALARVEGRAGAGVVMVHAEISDARGGPRVAAAGIVVHTGAATVRPTGVSPDGGARPA
ncbi:hypothetical protein P7L78_10805 [Tistrella bauzanensis]|uniref:hypothetical protein n=1 Tax=Tistrella TaxID=171436 RepID=UPI0031F6B539